ncbi:MAG: polysaccharide deacetylase family protein [Lachnospiraceae bacterium]|nr:polysaccharide deacetylase family protein [Lachnospiraceae bacterium]
MKKISYLFAAALMLCGCAQTIPTEDVKIYDKSMSATAFVSDTTAEVENESSSQESSSQEDPSPAENENTAQETTEIVIDMSWIIEQSKAEESKKRSSESWESLMKSVEAVKQYYESSYKESKSIADSIAESKSREAEANKPTDPPQPDGDIAARLAEAIAVDKTYWVNYRDPKVVYFTFDDGPSSNTPAILDILDRYGVKATFFVTYQPGYEQYYRDIVNRGHTIAVHTAYHHYEEIYTSYDKWLADFNLIYNYIKEVTGVTPKFYRFPGGSKNGYFTKDPALKLRIINYLDSLGIEYFDWNVVTGDGGNVTANEEITNASTVKKRLHPVVLAHDSSAKPATVEALPYILQYYIDWGYSFDRITERTAPIHQGSAWDY